MNYYGPHMGGGESVDQQRVHFLMEYGFTAFQFFASNPQTKVHPGVQFKKFYWMNCNRVKIVIHSPYWVSCFNNKTLGYHLNYINSLAEMANETPVYYVTHIGSPISEVDEERELDSIVAFLKKANNWRVRILLENDSGSKGKGTVPIEVLKEATDQFANVGLCLDTEHAYAGGESFDGLDLDWFDVIHLNAVPPYVKFGGHLDRHSWTPLERSKPEINMVLESLKYVEEKIIIFERRDIKVTARDFKFVNRIIDQEIP